VRDGLVEVHGQSRAVGAGAARGGGGAGRFGIRKGGDAGRAWRGEVGFGGKLGLETFEDLLEAEADGLVLGGFAEQSRALIGDVDFEQGDVTLLLSLDDGFIGTIDGSSRGADAVGDEFVIGLDDLPGDVAKTALECGEDVGQVRGDGFS
jgi:hypothetical protein